MPPKALLHGASAKTQSTPSSEKIGKYFSLRLGAKIFVEVVPGFSNPKFNEIQIGMVSL